MQATSMTSRPGNFKALLILMFCNHCVKEFCRYSFNFHVLKLITALHTNEQTGERSQEINGP